MNVIPILCPECGAATLTPRQPYDYPEAVRLEVLCPECAGGDFAESCYYDRDGNHIFRDPNDVLDSERYLESEESNP